MCFLSEVTFFGHKCTAKDILPDVKKIDTIKNYTTPVDKDVS